MTVVYRTMWEDERTDLAEVVRGEFFEWLGVKGIRADGPPDEDWERAGDGWKVDQVVAADGPHGVLRLRLDEDRDVERWTTIVHVLSDGEARHVWVDLERVSEDVYDHPPNLGSPRIVRRLVVGGHATRGNLALTTEAMTGTSSDVGRFVELLRSPERTLPVVVFAVGAGQPIDEVRERAQIAAEAVSGVAWVCTFPATAVERLNSELGRALEVRGRSVRTYLPDLENGPAYRHRFIPSSVVERHRRAATNRLTRELFPKASAARPPRVYREHIRPLLFTRTSTDQEAWDLAFEQQAEADELADRVEEITLERDIAREELVGLQSELQDALNRVRYLQQQVVDLDVTEAFHEPSKDVGSIVPSGNSEVVDLVRTHLGHIVMGPDVGDGAAYLDDFPEAASWAGTAWRSFLALEAYAELRGREGAIGDFRAANQAGKLDTYTIPGHWIAMHESTTTRQGTRFRAERTFDVPTSVDPAGEVFMAAHLKIKQGGVPAPRIHFHDDTAGTGKIYVGHYGDHLANQQTN